MLRRLFAVAGFAAVLFAFSATGVAATRTWQGNGSAPGSDNGLNTTGNWAGGLPGTADDAVIVLDRKQNTGVVLTNTTAQPFSVQNLVISNATTRLDLGTRTDSVAFSGPVTLSSNLVVGAISGANNYNLSVSFNNTTLMRNGVFNGAINSGTTRASATLAFAGSSTSIQSNLTFNGNTGVGVLNLGGTTVTIGRDLVFNGGAGTNLLNLTAATTVSNNFAITGNVGAAASNLVSVTGNLTVLRTLSLVNGSARNTLKFDAANINITNLTVSGSGATPYLIVGAGRTVNIGGNFSTDSLNLNTGEIRIGGSFSNLTSNANKAGFQAGLGTLTFNGGGTRTQLMEVASIGTVTANNYLIGTFQIGTSAGALGNVKLVDSFVNNATAPEQLLASNLIVRSGSQLDVSGLSAAFFNGTNAGTIAGITSTARGLEVLTQLNNTGTILLGGGSVIGSGVVTNAGAITGFGGVATPLVNLSSGVLTPINGALSFAAAPVQNGIVNVSSSGTLSVGAAWQNNGTINLLGGTIIGSSLANLGTISGSGSIVPNLNNSGTIIVTGVGIGFSGLVTNGGSIQITSSVGTFSSAVVNNGLLNLSSAQAVFGDKLTIPATGVIAADANSVLRFRGDVVNNSTQSNSVDLSKATLFFDGGGGINTQQFTVAGIDFGATLAGFTNNYAIGSFNVGGSNSIVQLVGFPGHALYLSNLTVFADSTLLLNGLNVYTLESPSILGTIVFNGGSLEVVPEPNPLVLVGGGLLLLTIFRRTTKGSQAHRK